MIISKSDRKSDKKVIFLLGDGFGKRGIFWEIDEEDKKLDFEVYPRLVEQLIWKIKEAQEKTPKRIAAREDFDELIQRIQKLAKV